ncbi:DUF1003 domain-containing protein [Trichocoleus desertorum AS-A10]|uniref:DUF1003 domain-containing protein n=1 Tax=Trichocoleus desertorum TaxID=1481672 RepID=UPI0032974EF4
MRAQHSTQQATTAKENKVIELRQKKTYTALQEIEQQRSQPQKLTTGQRVADKLAAKVGSWGFLIGQTTILTGWVTFNLMPGVPHWDEQPFILLNLVFSFASAYTAPIVLMSQNRQSDAEREKSEYDRQVNLKAGYDIGLLHEKIDTLQAQQLKELTLIVREQQHSLNEMKATVLPVLQQQERSLNELKVSILPIAQQQLQEIKVGDEQSSKSNNYSVYFPFNVNSIE